MSPSGAQRSAEAWFSRTVISERWSSRFIPQQADPAMESRVGATGSVVCHRGKAVDESEVATLTMSPTTITALAAIFGSLSGGLASAVSTWIAQRHQSRHDLLARKIMLREQLYSDFISESSARARTLCSTT